MKVTNLRRLGLVASAALAAVTPLLVSPPVAWACPMCKEAVEGNPGAAAGYNWSVLVLAALPFLLLAVISLNTAQALNPEAYAAAQRRLRGMWRPRSAAYALAGLLGLAGATYLIAPTQPAASLRWQPATVVGRRNLSGTGLVQTGDLTDRVVVITFFATWCTPCREQVLEASQLRRWYPAGDLAIVAVNAFEDYKIPHTHADGTIHYHAPSNLGSDLPSFLLTVGPGPLFVFNTPEISQALGGVTRIPTTFVFDRDGRLVRRYVNDSTGEFVKPTLEMLRADVERATACGRYSFSALRAVCLKTWG